MSIVNEKPRPSLMTVDQWDALGAVLLIFSITAKVSGTYRVLSNEHMENVSVAVAVWWALSAIISVAKAYDFGLKKSAFLSVLNLIQDLIVLGYVLFRYGSPYGPSLFL